MFLPVLLMRDYGLWGFVVFAVPNVIGAGAMGWVLRNREQSLRVLTAHKLMVSSFSAVTAAFHIWLFTWLVVLGSDLFNVQGPNLPFGMFVQVVAPALIVLLVCLFGFFKTAAALALVWSAGIGVRMLDNGWISMPSASTPIHPSLVGLAGVCAFGFALCPYLDATFHLARLRSGRLEARSAFSIGFGCFFLLMILLTAGYAGMVHPALGFDGGGARMPPIFYGLLLSHIAVQSLFTLSAHSQALVRTLGVRRLVLVASVVSGLCAVIYVAAHALDNRSLSQHARLTGPEIIYRLFMSFYGLLFPAYVWLCMIPIRGEKHTQKPTRQKLTVLAIACMLAAPCYWMGFIKRETHWLIPGLGLVLMARLFIRPSTLTTRSEG